MNQVTHTKLTGMTCEACTRLVQRYIKKLPGVETVEVDLASGNVSIHANRKVDTNEIKSALEGTQYVVTA